MKKTTIILIAVLSLFLMAFQPTYIQHDSSTGNVNIIIRKSGGALRVVDTSGNSVFYRTRHMGGVETSPGGSGATLTVVNGQASYLLDNATEYLYFTTHMDDDWDGATDVIFRVRYALNVAGTADADTVDISMLFNYGGDHDNLGTTKTQTVEVAHTVGATRAQYDIHESTFTLNWDLADNILENSDSLSARLNLETDTSEIDAILVIECDIFYQRDAIGELI